MLQISYVMEESSELMIVIRWNTLADNGKMYSKIVNKM